MHFLILQHTLVIGMLHPNYIMSFSFTTAVFFRPVVPGCAGCAMAHPDFGRSVNPISTRGDKLCLITTDTPGFSDLPTALFLGRRVMCHVTVHAFGCSLT